MDRSRRLRDWLPSAEGWVVSFLFEVLVVVTLVLVSGVIAFLALLVF